MLEAFYGGAAGGGKLLSLDELVPTPDRGLVKMADINPGDYIFGMDGWPVEVLAESEIMFVSGYRFTFDDGSQVVSNDKHRWLTFDAKELAALTRHNPGWRARRRAKRPSRATGLRSEKFSKAISARNTLNTPPTKPAPVGSIRTTEQIVASLMTESGHRNHAVPVAASLLLCDRDLLLDPYLLGCWLGDGTTKAGQITSMDDEIFDAFREAFKEGATQTKPDNRARATTFYQLTKPLRKLGVFGNKHIPDEYLWASETQRLALLQGLMDTDGWVERASVSFTNTNRALTEGVAHLARSLGMKCNVREGRAKLYGKDCGPKWTVKFAANRVVFRLPRKANAQSISSRRTTKFRYIISAERTDPEPMKCIKIGADDGMFLCTENMIPTHNSDALLMAAAQYVDVPGYAALILRRNYKQLSMPGALMHRSHEWWDRSGASWSAAHKTWMFPGGGTITFGHVQNPADVSQYESSEFQFIAFDEVTQFEESVYQFMFSRLRRVHGVQVPLRMRSASNPSGIGFNWVKRRFVAPETRDPDTVFIAARLRDNPYLVYDEYVASLGHLAKTLREKLLAGDWEITEAGEMFSPYEWITQWLEAAPRIDIDVRVRAWDLAFAAKTEDNDPDWTAGALMSRDARTGLFTIEHVIRFREAPGKTEKIIRATAERDGIGVPVYIEKMPGAGKQVSDRYKRQVLIGFSARDSHPAGMTKARRAEPFAAAMENGIIRCVRAAWNENLFTELSQFPDSGDHDDMVDALVYAYRAIAQPSSIVDSYIPHAAMTGMHHALDGRR